MTATLIPMLVFQPMQKSSTTGQMVPIPGGKLYTYAAGTTTPLAVYSDAGGATPLANPVILDANGIAQIYLGTASYKFLLTDSVGATIYPYPIDNVQSEVAAAAIFTNLLRSDLASTASAALGDALIGVKSTLTGAVATTQHKKNAEDLSVADFGVITGVDDTTMVAAAINAANGRRLFFPEGTYVITSTQLFTGLYGTSLIGVPFKSIITVDTHKNLWQFDATCERLTFDGLTFVGKNTAENNECALNLKAPSSIVTNCFFHDFNQGLSINSNLANDCHVTNNWFKDIIGATSGNGYAIYNIGNRTIITGNSFSTVGRHDVYLSGDTTPGGSCYCAVTGNVSTGNVVESIAVYATASELPVIYTVISNNVIKDQAGYGIGLDQQVLNCVVSNNVITGGVTGIHLNGSTAANTYPLNNLITGNRIHGSTYRSIDIVNGFSNLVIGNSISGTPSSYSISCDISGGITPPPSGNILGPNLITGSNAVTQVTLNAGVWSGTVVPTLQQNTITVTSNASTIDATGCSLISVANTIATTLTTLTGVDGQEVTLVFSNSNTTVTTAGNFWLSATPFNTTIRDTLTLVNSGGAAWYEKSRSVN